MKILNRRNLRRKLDSKLEKNMPPECKKINCPFEEKPVCAKFFYKNKKSKPFYVSMINECEMSYMKCHRGLESTIVPMANCHSGVENLQAPVQIEKKRSKRSAKEASQATPKVKSANTNRKEALKQSKSKMKPKRIIKTALIAKSLNSNRPIRLKGKTNVKNVRLNQKIKLKSKKKNTDTTIDDRSTTLFQETNTVSSYTAKNETALGLVSQNVTNVANKTVVFRNKINMGPSNNTTVALSQTNVEIVDQENITDNDKIDLKVVTDKNTNVSNNKKVKSKTAITFKTKLKNKLNLKLKPSNDKPVRVKAKTDLKNNKKTKVGLKLNAPKNLSKNTKKRNAGKRVLRQETSNGKQFLEKNLGKDKMFTYDVFSKDRKIDLKPDISDVAVDENVDWIPNTAENVALPEADEGDIISIDGEVEIDDKDLNEFNIETNNDEQTKNADSNNSNAVLKEATEDIIDSSVRVDDVNSQENLNDEVENVENDPKQNLNVVKYDELNHPLVIEPKAVDETEVFNDEEEYHYVPQGGPPPIVKLETDDNHDSEEKNVANVPSDVDTPLQIPPVVVTPEKPIDVNNDEDEHAADNEETPPIPADTGSPEEHISGGDDIHVTDDKENREATSNVINNESPESATVVPSGVSDRLPMPSNKYIGADDKVDLEQYNAECPSQCPARDLMVCAVCSHGIYKTFLSICHMRMYQCRNQYEQLELVSRFPCVMSAPLVTADPQMQPQGRLSEPNDQDRVLLYVRCREKGMLGKNPRCTFEENKKLNEQEDVTLKEASPLEY